MDIAEKHLEEFKKICREKLGKKISDKEAREEMHNLVAYCKVVLQIAERQHAWNQKLKKYPKGFPLDDGKVYSCCICHKSVSNEESWYDKHGIKCLNCQRALDKKVIPVIVCKDSNSWYAMWELKHKLGIHPQTARKLLRQGKLKARTITDKQGNPREYIFLKKENPSLKEK